MVAKIREGILTRPATMDDIPAIVALTNSSMVADADSAGLTAAALTELYSQSFFAVERDTRLIFAPDGTLAAAAECWARAPYVAPYVWGTVHPDYRGRGYGCHLLDWATGRARQVFQLAPAEARVVLRASAVRSNTDALQLFADHGYDHVRSYWRMTIEMNPDQPPPRPQWPRGVRVRCHVSGQDDFAVYQVSEAAFKDHWGYLPTTYENWRESKFSPETCDPSLWFLAVVDGPGGEQIVGESLCRIGSVADPEMGYVMSLVVLREWRRRGIALALLRHTFAEFYRRGVYRVGLRVDAQNLTGATRLYEKAGMRVALETQVYEKVLREGVDLSTQALEG